jgi:hypothetical protein
MQQYRNDVSFYGREMFNYIGTQSIQIERKVFQNYWLYFTLASIIDFSLTLRS